MTARKLLGTLCGGLLMSMAGCGLSGEQSQVIRIRPDQRYIDYEQSFQEAFAAPAADGGYDLVLAKGIFSAAQDQGVSLYSASSGALSQAVIIHVAWRPTAAAMGDYPAAANSTVDWYVFDNSSGGGWSQYQGIGFVRVRLWEKQSQFELRDVQIRPTVTAQSMRDPLGSSRITGTIVAMNSSSRARAVIDEVSRRRQAQSTAMSVTAGTPASRQTGDTSHP